MKQLLLLLTGILCALPAFTQAITGVVKDSTGKAIPYASINLRNKTDNTIVAYTMTDAQGAYRLQLPNNTNLYLEASSIGYKTQRKALTGTSVDFSLAISVSELPTVIVRQRPVLRTNGDTTSYKVSEFSSPQDRVIGDLIKRLPGISVADDGTITYNNRPISGIYIGGDNLLDDKYSIAANTIPNSVVDKVQVIDNHQPIKALQNKVMSNDVVLNLELKSKATVGQETIGAGLPHNYNAELNLLLLKDQYKGIDYLKANNTGDDLQQELLSHNAANNQQRTGDTPPATMLSLGAVNTPNLSHQRYVFNNTALLNANNLVNLKNSPQLRINAYYLHDQQQQDYSQRTSVYLPGDTIQYTELQHNQFNPALFHTQLTLNENKEKYYLNNVLNLDDNRSVNYSALNTNGTPVNQVLRDHSLSSSNEFNLIKSLRSNNIVEGYSYISHFAAPETRTLGPGYNAALFNQNVPYTQLIQNVNVPTWFTNNYISFKIPGDNFTQSFKAGFSLQSQTLSSTLNVQQLNKTINPAADSTQNLVNWNNKKYYAEAAYDIPAGKFKGNLTLPLTLQQLNYLDKTLTRLYFNPQLDMKYQIGIENFINLLYNYQNETGNIEDIYPGYILKDYRTLSANAADLTIRQHQSAAAGFSYRKALQLFFFSINAAYDHIHASNIAASILTNNLLKGIVLPYPNSTDSWTITGSISKYSFALHTTFSANMQWQESHAVQLQNNILLPVYMTSERLTLSAATKVNGQLNFSYYATGIQTNTSANHIRQLQQQASIYYYPLTNLQFKLSGDHYFTSRPDNANLAYFFADASAKYHIQKWNIDLQPGITNLLNVKTYNALYLSTNMLTASSYTLPGRRILLKVLFNL